MDCLHSWWRDAGDARGRIKIVMSGSASDEKGWQPHILADNCRMNLQFLRHHGMHLPDRIRFLRSAGNLNEVIIPG
jgi:hypothetical protein